MRFAFDPCPEDQAFRFKNGARARSLDELKKEVQKAPGEVLSFHRTHFHFWVRDILQEPKLAEQVKAEGERAKDPEQLRRTLDGLLDRTLTDAKQGMPKAGGRR